MKFTIKVDDFWLEEEELTGALQSHIKNSVVAQITKNIEDKVDKQITQKINEVIEEKISLVIDSTITDLLATGTLTQSGEEVLITDHIKSLFKQNRGWDRVHDQIERIAKKFCEEVKVQYNNAFANHIVKGMKEQGLLKTEVVQILLEGKPE